MRRLIPLIFFAFPAHAEDAFVAAGIGIPELLRVEAGWFVHERVSVQVIAGFPLLAPLAGLGVTGWLLGDSKVGRPPTHTLLVSASARLRVDAPDRFEVKGDSLGAAGEVMAGYGLLTEGGFVLRAQAGAILYAEHGLAAGPQAIVTAGYAF